MHAKVQERLLSTSLSTDALLGTPSSPAFCSGLALLPMVPGVAGAVKPKLLCALGVHNVVPGARDLGRTGLAGGLMKPAIVALYDQWLKETFPSQRVAGAICSPATLLFWQALRRLQGEANWASNCRERSNLSLCKRMANMHGSRGMRSGPGPPL